MVNPGAAADAGVGCSSQLPPDGRRRWQHGRARNRLHDVVGVTHPVRRSLEDLNGGGGVVIAVIYVVVWH